MELGTSFHLRRFSLSLSPLSNLLEQTVRFERVGQNRKKEVISCVTGSTLLCALWLGVYPANCFFPNRWDYDI